MARRRGSGSWRGPEFEGEFPTLGWQVLAWMQANCVQPDGRNAGKPFVPSTEQKRIFLFDYRINPAAAWDGQDWVLPFVYFRGTQVKAPQKWGKGPMSAAKILAECAPDGPVLFDGWDANGNPVGRPWPAGDQWWQVTATTESQTANIWRSLRPMIEHGPLGADLDTGEAKVHLPGGGLIETVTASAPARRGQRITGAAQDETSDWFDSNGGVELSDTQRRNLAGTNGRFFETANAFDPSRGSVAQLTAEDQEPGVFKYNVEAGPGSIEKPEELDRMVDRAYEGAPWVPRERINAEIRTLAKRDPAQAERFFLNRDRASAGAAFDLEVYKTRAVDHTPEPGAKIVIGIAGARFGDALGAIATEICTGYQWPLGHWERPDDAEDSYEHPFEEIDGHLDELHEDFEVVRAYVATQHIETWFQTWQGRFGKKVVLPWRTSRPREMGTANRKFVEAIGTAERRGKLTHSGDQTTARHIGNAKKAFTGVVDERRVEFWKLAKDRPGAYVDEAQASVLSWEARGDAIAAGALEEPPPDSWDHLDPSDFNVSSF